jgi:hypothetical protein
MSSEITESVPEPSPRVLLDEVRNLQQTVRRRRHAYWLPLLVFGLLTCAAAPMYVGNPAAAANAVFRSRNESDSLGLLGGMADPTLESTSTLRAVYWLFALVVSALVTVGWYGWHGSITGVRTRVRTSVALWIGVTVALLAVSVAMLSVVWRLWPLTTSGAAPVLVIAVGLVALSWVERSRLLAGITAVFAAASVYSVVATPENLLYRLLSGFGVSAASMPYEEANVVRVLVPGVVLVVGAVVAVAADVRHR